MGGAERGRERDLFLTRRAASEQQVGEVGAGDQQHHHHRAERDIERAPQRAVDQRRIERLDA